MTERDKKKSNKNILRMIYTFTLLFFGMIGYMVYFIGFQADGLMGNPYNTRMEVFNQRFIRGSILASDGTVLARTNVAEDGTETRVYPFSNEFAHAVGYSTKGKTGLEALCNFYLMKSNTNPVQQVANELTETKSLGDNVTTTLDVGLQETAYAALQETGKKGAVICMDPSTGEILAMVSNPDFDPNTIAEEWDSIVSGDSSSGELVNRATQGLYPPGSTFKILMTLEYLREHPGDYQDFSFTCNGYYQSPENEDYVVHCYDNEVHGTQDLGEAFANSCNSAFAELGTEVDKEKLAALAEELMFNQELPVGITASQSRFKVNKNSSTWTMMQSAIGQGETVMTPLHSMLISAAIANNGVLQEPVLLKNVTSADGKTVTSFQSSGTRTLMSETEAGILKEYMRRVVSEGTASKLRTEDYEACGKTGSAEYTEDGDVKTDAWFTGFAPMEDPQLAICVVIEDGETGGRTAVPVARQIFDYWLLNR